MGIELEDNTIMWLSRVKGISFKSIYKIVRHFKGTKLLWSLDDNTLVEELCKIDKIGKRTAEELLKSRGDGSYEKYIKELGKLGITYISFFNSKFPRGLKEIPDPPAGLYIIGKLPSNNLNFVSIVGTRKSTEYGRKICYEISKELVKNNCVVVSGMASGIDTVSHIGAVENQGLTIAVLGNGVDICYPKENKLLMEKIKEKGCVISEYPPEYKSSRFTFPARNRIIAGLSEYTVVIEAKKGSGSLITAKDAFRYNRNVYAVCGSVFSELGEGTNRLIKEGAGVIINAQDFVNDVVTGAKSPENILLSKGRKKLGESGYNKTVIIGRKNTYAEDLSTIKKDINEYNEFMQILTSLKSKELFEKLEKEEILTYIESFSSNWKNINISKEEIQKAIESLGKRDFENDKTTEKDRELKSFCEKYITTMGMYNFQDYDKDENDNIFKDWKGENIQEKLLSKSLSESLSESKNNILEEVKTEKVENKILEEVETEEIENNILEEVKTEEIENIILKEVKTEEVENKILEEVKTEKVENNILEEVENKEVENNILEEVENKEVENIILKEVKTEKVENNILEEVKTEEVETKEAELKEVQEKIIKKSETIIEDIRVTEVAIKDELEIKFKSLGYEYTENAKNIFNVIPTEGKGIKVDEIYRITNIRIADIQITLTILEIESIIEKKVTGYIKKV